MIIDRLVKIKEWIDKNDPGALVILMSCAVELKLMDLTEEEQKQYLEEAKITRWPVFICSSINVLGWFQWFGKKLQLLYNLTVVLFLF